MAYQYELKLAEDSPGAARHAGRLQFAARGVPVVIDVEPLECGAILRPRAAKAQRALLPQGAIALDAFRLTLMQCRWHIASNVPAVVEARDVEGLHQLRVGLRRLRVALTSFGAEFRTPQFETVKLRAKALADRLARARDLDVFADELFEPAASANGAKDAFDLLRARTDDARRTAWNDAVLQLSGGAFRGFMQELGEAVDRGPRPVAYAGSAGGLLAFDQPVTALADRTLAFRQSRACRRARRLDALSVDQRHALRIALKKLRYTAEFFAPLYAEKPIAKFLRRLAGMQDILGALNDVAVAQKTLEGLLGRDDSERFAHRSEMSFAAGVIYGWHLERAARTWEDAVTRWKKFVRTEPFWNAASVG